MLKNPYDHSKCDHEKLTFPVGITDEFYVDLLHIFGNLWKYCASGDVGSAMVMLETLGEWINTSLLGDEDSVNAEVEMYRGFSEDMKALEDEDEFDESLKRLLEDE